MRKSKMLQKFRSGGFARVCGLGHYLPFYIRYAAHYKFDGIWLDLEHRAMDAREVQAIIMMCLHNDIDCMVRAPTLERTKLYRYLEDGASRLPHAPDLRSANGLVIWSRPSSIRRWATGAWTVPASTRTSVSQSGTPKQLQRRVKSRDFSHLPGRDAAGRGQRRGDRLDRWY